MQKIFLIGILLFGCGFSLVLAIDQLFQQKWLYLLVIIIDLIIIAVSCYLYFAPL